MPFFKITSSFHIFREEGKAFIFQCDNTSPHLAKKTKIYAILRGIAVPSMLANDPDLHIIENAWLFTKNKNKLNNNIRYSPKANDELITRVFQE